VPVNKHHNQPKKSSLLGFSQSCKDEIYTRNEMLAVKTKANLPDGIFLPKIRQVMYMSKRIVFQEGLVVQLQKPTFIQNSISKICSFPQFIQPNSKDSWKFQKAYILYGTKD